MVLEHAQFDVVVVNGRAVIDALARSGIAKLQNVGTFPCAGVPYTLNRSESHGFVWAGWSLNVQGTPGVSNDHLGKLGDLLATVDSPAN